MKKALWFAVVGVVAVSGAGVADSDCWIVDATDPFIGECASFAPGATSTLVRFQNAGVDSYFQLDSAGGPVFAGTYLLEDTETDCSGQAYLPYSCGAAPCLSPAWVANRGLITLAGIADRSQAPVLRHIVAVRAADGSCELQTPYDELAYPARGRCQPIFQTFEKGPACRCSEPVDLLDFPSGDSPGTRVAPSGPSGERRAATRNRASPVGLRQLSLFPDARNCSSSKDF